MAHSAKSAPLPVALADPACYPHPVRRVRLIQTHISWVLLTGSYAYKIKKPVNLGFLDFTTLASRRHYCEEELRLNRRLAPGLYLEVVAITGTPQRPAIGGDGPAIEYAVKMKQFPQSALLDKAIARSDFDAVTVDALARTIADFHARLEPQAAVNAGDAGASVLAPARANFEQMLPLLKTPADIALLSEVSDWMLREYGAHAARFEQRYAQGCVRECHGDLHLGNIVLIDGAAIPFDCLEFSRELRWTDVMSEVAFLAMDLEAHGRRDLAYTFIDAYLETSGDYDGVQLLPFYLAYRAAVRAKVNLLRAAQPGTTSIKRRRAMADYRRYMALAADYARCHRGAVIITHGLSGSGKSTLTRPLSAELGAIRVRSDVERKRRHGANALARTASAVGGGIYTDRETGLTYEQLLGHARCIATAGVPVIVDATFLKRAQRAAFRALADELRLPFAIVNATASAAELRARIATRVARGGDASEATSQVLEAQMQNREALTGEEMRYAIDARVGDPVTGRQLLASLRGMRAAPNRPPRRDAAVARNKLGQ